MQQKGLLGVDSKLAFARFEMIDTVLISFPVILFSFLKIRASNRNGEMSQPEGATGMSLQKNCDKLSFACI